LNYEIYIISAYRQHFIAPMGVMGDTIPIFLHPFYLDAVYGENSWRVAFTVDEQGQLASVNTYAIQHRLGIRRVLMPPLTPFSGVWMKEKSFSKNYKQNGYIKQLLSDLIAQLPHRNVHFWSQKLHFSLVDWQPFYWAGFEQTTHYTYILPDLTDLPKIFANCNDNTKRNIQKAEKQSVRCEKNNDFDAFYALTNATYERQNMEKNLVPHAIFKRLNDVLQQRHLAQIHIAYNDKNEAIAGIYIVYDHQTAYYLAGGANAEGRNAGAWHALMWQAIQTAADRNMQIFDFEGSMLASVESVFRAFGATAMPYHRIRRYKNRFWATVGLWLSWR
jgi:Acetyltransferase (GNAT) domain